MANFVSITLQAKTRSLYRISNTDVLPVKQNYRQPLMGSPWPIAKPIASRPIPVQHQHLQHLLAHCHHPYLAVRPTQAHTQVFPLPGGFPWAHSSRGKPRRGMMRRAVFSDLQRKGLEKRFQVQKYISKPDRKKLAEKLGLKDNTPKALSRAFARFHENNIEKNKEQKRLLPLPVGGRIFPEGENT
ncbi:hypothetical protein ACJJTC_011020 [Scirpophaga incertulas]